MAYTKITKEQGQQFDFVHQLVKNNDGRMRYDNSKQYLD